MLTGRPYLGVMHHYAFVPEKTRKGIRVSHVMEYRSRGEADIASLRLAGRHGDGSAASIEGPLVDGDLIDPKVVDGRPQRATPLR